MCPQHRRLFTSPHNYAPQLVYFTTVHDQIESACVFASVKPYVERRKRVSCVNELDGCGTTVCLPYATGAQMKRVPEDESLFQLEIPGLKFLSLEVKPVVRVRAGSGLVVRSIGRSIGRVRVPLHFRSIPPAQL